MISLWEPANGGFAMIPKKPNLCELVHTLLVVSVVF
jgi:hypothetical protein